MLGDDWKLEMVSSHCLSKGREVVRVRGGGVNMPNRSTTPHIDSLVTSCYFQAG